MVNDKQGAVVSEFALWLDRFRLVWGGSTPNAMILHVLWIARTKSERVSIAEISERAGIALSRVVQCISDLKARGMVKAEGVPGRSEAVEMTDATIVAMRAAYQEVYEGVARTLLEISKLT
jgi:hypothetical protein